ncbi:MAG: hypothetical protein OXH66_15355 [Gemmatimonadetes bacterium]|nr:hypothetical protein [Gemmatimonadota bacterium]
MRLSADDIARYMHTFIDFCRLGPAAFTEARGAKPSRYLSPYQFCAWTLVIGFAIAGATFVRLHFATTGTVKTGLASANAAGVVTVAVSSLVLSSLMFRAISRAWPIRGHADFSSIFEIHCYLLAMGWLPTSAINLLLIPWLAGLAAAGTLAVLSVFLVPVLVIGAPIGLLRDILWGCPGIAAVNGVPTSRVWAGLLFWSAMAGAGVGAVGVFVLVALA